MRLGSALVSVSIIDMTKFSSIIKSWLPLVIAITLICGIIYITTQQAYRHSANDPQIQMAEDAAAALASGLPPSAFVTGPPYDMAASLAPYLIIFSESGVPIASSVSLDGRTPQPPDGVFEYTRQHKQDRITWQPRPGVRQAAVIVHYASSKSGFVLSGRSLRETENRIGILGTGILIGWLVTLFASLITVIFMESISNSRRKVS